MKAPKTPPRGLTPEESALWAKLARSVTPLKERDARPVGEPHPAPVAPPPRTPVARKVKGRVPPRSAPVTSPAPTPALHPTHQAGLDSHWEKRLGKGTLAPDFTLDLHGHTLDAAHARLDWGLTQAKAMGARVVLVVTGKPRPAAAADRAERRGAIRAKIVDWLAAGPHGSDIAAIRKAHRRHGGEGAIYLILKRRR